MELLQHGADPSLRNTEQKTALDVADPLTKPVLTGTDYKKDDLLEAARRWFGNHRFSNINDNCFTLKWERGETSCPADAAQCELPRERREEVDAVAPGCGLQQDQDCTAAAHPRCWCSRQGQGWLGATAQCLQLWPLWGHDMSKITKMAKKTIMCQSIKIKITTNRMTMTTEKQHNEFPGDRITDHSWSKCERNGPVAVHPPAWGC